MPNLREAGVSIPGDASESDMVASSSSSSSGELVNDSNVVGIGREVFSLGGSSGGETIISGEGRRRTPEEIGRARIRRFKSIEMRRLVEGGMDSSRAEREASRIVEKRLGIQNSEEVRLREAGVLGDNAKREAKRIAGIWKGIVDGHRKEFLGRRKRGEGGGFSVESAQWVAEGIGDWWVEKVRSELAESAGLDVSAMERQKEAERIVYRRLVIVNDELNILLSADMPYDGAWKEAIRIGEKWRGFVRSDESRLCGLGRSRVDARIGAEEIADEWKRKLSISRAALLTLNTITNEHTIEEIQRRAEEAADRFRENGIAGLN